MRRDRGAQRKEQQTDKQFRSAGADAGPAPFFYASHDFSSSFLARVTRPRVNDMRDSWKMQARNISLTAFPQNVIHNKRTR
jgi:hypothetical protein